MEVENHKNFPFYLFLDGWAGASVSTPPARFSENVANTPDGGLIVKLLLEAKNATKTAKIFLALRCAPPRLAVIIPTDCRTPHRPHRSFSGFSGLINSPGWGSHK